MNVVTNECGNNDVGDNQAAVVDNQAAIQRGRGRGWWKGGRRQRRRRSFLDDLLYISRGVVTMVINAFLFVCDKFIPIVLPL